MNKLVLHGYWRSSATYRVRIALALKGATFDQAPHDLRLGAQRDAEYLALAPQGLVPVLETQDGALTQSLAILEWLEEEHPDPPLLPKVPLDRRAVRAMALIVACDIHPLNNTRVTRKLHQMGVDPAGISAWAQGWIRDGFDAIEPMIAHHGKGFAFG